MIMFRISFSVSVLAWLNLGVEFSLGLGLRFRINVVIKFFCTKLLHKQNLLK